MAIFNYSIFWRYVVQPFLRCLAGLAVSMNRQLEINDMNLQAANGRVPPSWGPEIEKSYPFRYYDDNEAWMEALCVTPNVSLKPKTIYTTAHDNL